MLKGASLIDTGQELLYKVYNGIRFDGKTGRTNITNSKNENSSDKEEKNNKVSSSMIGRDCNHSMKS